MTQESSAPSNSPSGYAAVLTYDDFFTFDNADNLFGFKTSSPATTGFGFNIDNQANSPFGFNFDGDGSMTAEPTGGYYSGATLAYDGEDRLTAIGSLFSAGYDGDGMRATSATSGGTVYYLYDGSGAPLVEETYNSSTSTASIAYVNAMGADGWRVRYSPNGRTYYAYDPQGTVANRSVDNNSTIASGGEPCTDVCVYDGYGEQLTDQWGGQTVDVQFTPNDPVGFEGQYGYYSDWQLAQRSNSVPHIYVTMQPSLLTSRYYDPSTGRFINRDPSGYHGGPNLYAYAGGNPVRYTDPSGLKKKDYTWLVSISYGIFGGGIGLIEGGGGGGVIGSVIPGAGTVAGAGVGAIAGAVIGATTGYALAQAGGKLGDVVSRINDHFSDESSSSMGSSDPMEEAMNGPDIAPDKDTVIPDEAEQQKLIGKWDKGTYDTNHESAWDHYGDHGKDVGAGNFWDYLKMAKQASLRIKGQGFPVVGQTPNVLRYFIGESEYIDMSPDGIISFGGKFH